MGLKYFLKQELWKWRGLLVAAPAVAVFVIALRSLGLLQLWEWAALDQYFRWRPVEMMDDRLVVVGIEESDIRKIGKWPIPDAVLAELLTKIEAQQPRAIGLDIYRDLPVEPGKQALEKVYQSNPNLIGIKKVVGEADTFGVNPPAILAEKGQVAANDFLLDADGKVRRGFLYLTDKSGNIAFSLPFKLAWMYLEATKGIQPELTKEQFVKLGQKVFPPFSTNDGGYVRANADGYQVLLNFRGPSCRIVKNGCPYRMVSMGDVLAGKIQPGLMRDRIVFIGSTAESLQDLFFTPYSSGLVTLPQPTSGVEIHANLTSQILSAVLDERPILHSWSEHIELLWIFLWSCTGASLNWKLRFSDAVSNILRQTLFRFLFAGGSLLASTYGAFVAGWWLPVVPPMLALTLSTTAISIHIARSAGDIRKAFGRYVNDEVVAILLENPEGLKLGGENRKVTILLSDLRGFTSISKPLPPEKVVMMLNIYLEAMADIITEYHGTIDKFIGDAIMVLFGAPTSRPDDAERAVACAIAMQLGMESVNQKLARLNLPQIEMGIGIHTGEVVVGNIGSQKHASYTAIGNDVNLVSRIESYTVGGQVIISENTLKELPNRPIVDEKITVQPKGFDEPMSLYAVGGIGGNYNLFLPTQESNMIPLKEEIKIFYTILDGKHISNQQYQGSLVKFSFKGAQMRAEHLIEIFSNIKINLIHGQTELQVGGDLYAKVVGKSKEGDGFILLRFTSVPPAIAAVLNTLYHSLTKKTN